MPQGFEVSPPDNLAGILEGEFRPGFFKGVCTIVLKLFNCVQPNVAFFGRKDYQQAMIVDHMVNQFALPVDIVKVPTRREVDGLAMSSRNGYLNDAERADAVQLYLVLCQMRESFKAGYNISTVEEEAKHHLQSRGWKPDYLTIRSALDLSPLSVIQKEGNPPPGCWIALGAARIGKTRLIDNLEFNVN